MAKMFNVNPNEILHVKAIHFANGDALEEKDVVIIGGFLIVAADQEGQAPTWYNLQDITALQEVTPETPSSKRQIRLLEGL